MLEGEYIELCEELKKKHEELEAKERKILAREGKLKVDIATMFGLVRSGDKLLNNIELPDDFITIWELICDCVFTSAKLHIFGLPIQEEPLRMEVHIINENPTQSEETNSESD